MGKCPAYKPQKPRTAPPDRVHQKLHRCCATQGGTPKLARNEKHDLRSYFSPTRTTASLKLVRFMEEQGKEWQPAASLRELAALSELKEDIAKVSTTSVKGAATYNRMQRYGQDSRAVRSMVPWKFKPFQRTSRSERNKRMWRTPQRTRRTEFEPATMRFCSNPNTYGTRRTTAVRGTWSDRLEALSCPLTPPSRRCL